MRQVPSAVGLLIAIVVLLIISAVIDAQLLAEGLLQ